MYHSERWGSISIDFIIKLPLSKEPVTGVKYNSILVIMDRLTKFAHFITYKEASTADNLTCIFLKTIASLHRLPDKIVLDRGSTFTSKFWQSLTAQLGVNHKLSTAYHPQTDGQTEQIN
jgi:transposase InsO family protein